VLDVFGLNCFRVTHKISGDCKTEMPDKIKSVSCMFDDLCDPHLFCYKSKHSGYTSLVLHISYCML
jgi:hypothetical protein